MRRPDMTAPPRPAGQGGARGADQEEISGVQYDRHGATVIQFRRAPRCCCACGQHFGPDHQGDTCPRCRAWDMLLRAMSLRRQALGELAKAGGC